MNIQDSIIFFMEISGTIAFAASGAMVGIRKRMDIFGICVLGVVTAVGGGMTRDVILGKLPSALEKPVYVVVSVITSLAIFILLYIKHDLLSGRLGTFYDKAMLIMDSVGLGIFTSLGVMSGIDNGYRNAYRCRRRSDARHDGRGGTLHLRKAYLCLRIPRGSTGLRVDIQRMGKTAGGIYRSFHCHGDPFPGSTLQMESSPSEILVITVAVFVE